MNKQNKLNILYLENVYLVANLPEPSDSPIKYLEQYGLSPIAIVDAMALQWFSTKKAVSSLKLL